MKVYMFVQKSSLGCEKLVPGRVWLLQTKQWTIGQGCRMNELRRNVKETHEKGSNFILVISALIPDALLGFDR